MFSPRLLSFGLAAAVVIVVANVPVSAQRGASGPPEHAKVTPINNLPNPYETVRNFGPLPNGRKWGSVRADSGRRCNAMNDRGDHATRATIADECKRQGGDLGSMEPRGVAE